jgi:hypothetical protein
MWSTLIFVINTGFELTGTVFVCLCSATNTILTLCNGSDVFDTYLFCLCKGNKVNFFDTVLIVFYIAHLSSPIYGQVS